MDNTRVAMQTVKNLGASVVWADGPGKGEGEKGKADKAPTQKPAAKKEAPDALTHEGLKERLELMGFEPEVSNSKAGSLLA